MAKAILDKCLMASRAREAARKARDLDPPQERAGVHVPARKAGRLHGARPEQVRDLHRRGRFGRPIRISIKNGRDRNFQAILPLRGKILNVEKTRLDKILANAEIKAMITAFGAGVGEEFKPRKAALPPHRLHDGCGRGRQPHPHPALTFFYRYMRPLIDGGYVYVAQPPLFKITKNKKEHYVYSDEELAAYLDEIGRGNDVVVQRYKGLGEMSAQQLWETTMDPSRRIMKRVKLEDAVSADEMFSLLMGDKVEPRREFITENANLVANLDI